MVTLAVKPDGQIKADVQNELKWDPRVDETDVGVQVRGGVVTLGGHVNAYGRKLAAREAAHRVHGVLDVVDEIRVKAPQVIRIADLPSLRSDGASPSTKGHVMTLTLWNRRNQVGGELAGLRDAMDRTLEQFFNEPWGLIEPKMLRSEGWLPPIDVSETDAEVTIRAEVPGVATKDLDVSVTGSMLTIAGQKQEHVEKKGEGFYRSERRFGSFRRVIDLPDTVDANKVTAESDNGVVTIHVAKAPSAKPRQVEVKPVGKKVAVAG